jgi:hypothetical protein
MPADRPPAFDLARICARGVTDGVSARSLARQQLVYAYAGDLRLPARSAKARCCVETRQRNGRGVAARGSRAAGGPAAVVHSRTCAAAQPTDRPICNARVPHAIGQSFEWLVSAEAEVLRARVAHRPAAFPLAELKQRASTSVVDRNVFSRRPRARERRPLVLSEDVRARTLCVPNPWSFRARKPCGTPLV